MTRVIDYLSPREYDEVAEAETRQRGWSRVLRCFLDGPRLRLGWDLALTRGEIERRAGLAAATSGEAIDEASRWATRHGLHLLGWEEEDGSRLYFMAVG